jgi:hypothetical protein
MRANVGGLGKTGRSRIRRGVQVIDVHAEANLQKFGDVLLDLGWDAVRYPIHTAARWRVPCFSVNSPTS